MVPPLHKVFVSRSSSRALREARELGTIDVVNAGKIPLTVKILVFLRSLKEHVPGGEGLGGTDIGSSDVKRLIDRATASALKNTAGTMGNDVYKLADEMWEKISPMIYIADNDDLVDVPDITPAMRKELAYLGVLALVCSGHNTSGMLRNELNRDLAIFDSGLKMPLDGEWPPWGTPQVFGGLVIAGGYVVDPMTLNVYIATDVAADPDAPADVKVAADAALESPR